MFTAERDKTEKLFVAFPSLSTRIRKYCEIEMPRVCSLLESEETLKNPKFEIRSTKPL